MKNNLLAIETATSVCGIALFKEGNLKGIEEDIVPKKHAELLPKFYRSLQEKTGFRLSDLDGIAISIGPGSFTGLRIGLSYAKGLAFSGSIPIIPVPTLSVLAQSMLSLGEKFASKTVIRCALNSYKDKVFYQDFQIFADRVKEVSTAELVLWSEMISTLPESYFLCHFECDHLVNRHEIPCPVVRVTPSTRFLGELALTEFGERSRVDFRHLEPNYISQFQIGK